MKILTTYSNRFEFTTPAISIGLKSPLNKMLLAKYLEFDLLYDEQLFLNNSFIMPEVSYDLNVIDDYKKCNLG